MRLSTGIWATASVAWIAYVATHMPWEGWYLLYGFFAALFFPAIAFVLLMFFRYLLKAKRP